MREDHCARCGYLSEYHDVARRCPGMKTGKWTERDPIDGALWPEILARDVAARMRSIEEARRPYVPVIVEPPIVCARPPRAADEFAAGTKGGKQAVALGRVAARARFDVQPLYWRSGTGMDGCAVRGRREDLSFVATWKRKAGEREWSTDVAYVWSPLRKVGHTELSKIIRGE